MERLTNEKDLKNIEEFKQTQNTIKADADYFFKLYKKLYWLENNIDVSKEEKTIKDKILLVEDGSVDVESLEQKGFCVIVYRQGGKKPEWLN